MEEDIHVSDEDATKIEANPFKPGNVKELGTKKSSEFLRLDHYEVDNGDYLIADDDFFKNQHTPSRSSLSSATSKKVEVVGLDKTPIMLMKQINRLSDSPKDHKYEVEYQQRNQPQQQEMVIESTRSSLLAHNQFSDLDSTRKRPPMTNDELLKRVLESREKFKRTVAATINELSDDTKELIAETKKDLNEIERVVGEFQSKQEEMKKVTTKAEAEVERLEAKELELIKNLKTSAGQQKKSKSSFSFWFFAVVLIALIVAVIQSAPIEWEYVNQKWDYAVEQAMSFLGIPFSNNAPY